MAAARADLVRRFYSAFSAGDLSAVLDTVDPDVEFEPVLGILYSRHVFHGREGIADWYGELRSDWDAFEITVENTFDKTDHLVAMLHLVAHRGEERLDADIAIEARFSGDRIKAVLGRDAGEVADELASGA